MTQHQDSPGGLSRFDDQFAATAVEPREREFDEVPDGKYHVVVDKVQITEAKSSGNTMVKWTLRIVGPRFAGRLLWRHHVLASHESLRWLKSDLHLCGLDLVKLSDLPQYLDTLLDLHLEVTKKNKGANTNIYFNRRLPQDELGSDDSFGHDGGDSVPF